MALIDIIIELLAGLILIPCLILFIECNAALLRRSSLNERSEVVDTKGIRVAVLIPAHNEVLEIGATLTNLQREVEDVRHLVVIADNCTDETAEVARSHGVTVIERTDTNRRGKGYALDYGLRYLEADKPDVVVMVDADCRVEPGSLKQLVQQAMRDRRPVQAIYLMDPPEQPSQRDYISTLAFLIKNWVRPLGLARLGLPCLLTGSGMAFRWDVIGRVSLFSGNIVEDMQLGLDLAIAGYSPRLCETAVVRGRFPQQSSAAQRQRKRWEHGHLKTILTQAPRLLWSGLQQQRWDLCALALDIVVPPLALLVLIWFGILTVALLGGYLGSGWYAVSLLLVGGLLLAWSIALSWTAFGRRMIPLLVLLRIPLYIFWKIPSYFQFVVQPEQQWVRTERDRSL